MTKHWPDNSPPHWKQSSTSKPRHLPSQTPMMPPTKDVPKARNRRVRTVDVQGSGMKIDKRNLIGHGVRAGNRVKVENEIRVTDVVRVRSGPRAVGVIRVECTASMRRGNPGSGHHSVKRRGPASPPVAPHNGMGSAPSSRCPQVNGRNSSN